MEFMDINTFSTYFIDNAKKVIDPIAYAGRYGRTKTKILNQPDYMYGYYGVYGDWGDFNLCIRQDDDSVKQENLTKTISKFNNCCWIEFIVELHDLIQKCNKIKF